MSILPTIENPGKSASQLHEIVAYASFGRVSESQESSKAQATDPRGSDRATGRASSIA